MKPLNKKVKVPKKAVRVESKNSVIEENFITLGIDCPEIGTVSATGNGKSQVDFDAFYIKKADEGKEKYIYFRKAGNQNRVFFAEKKDEGNIPFTAYILSEFSLNEILHGKDSRINDNSLVLADREIGENEIEYISAFLPEESGQNRKKGISIALTDDEKYEFTAFYWKKGKSFPCANGEYIPDLFDAFESVTFNNVNIISLAPSEEETALESDDEKENGLEEVAETEEIGEPAEPEDEPEESEEVDAQTLSGKEEIQQVESEEAETELSLQEDSADSEANEPEEEKKPKKEGFFQRRRKKKQQNKKNASEKEDKELAEQITPEPEQTEAINKEPEEEEISTEEIEALAVALATDIFSEQELEDIFENPLDDESEKVDETLEGQEEIYEVTELSDTITPEQELISEEGEAKTTSQQEQLPEQAVEPEIKEKKPAKKEKPQKKRKALFAKKEKKKKVSEPEHSAKKAKKKQKEKIDDELQIEQEINLESEQVLPEKPAESEEKFDVEEYFESEKPLTLLQILEAADISNDNKKTFLQYMKPAIMNTVYVVPISDSGENVDAVYVSKKAANLLEGKDYPIASNKELIFPDDDREHLRAHIKLKTIMSASEAYIPAFTSAEMFEQIFGKSERCGLFAFPNLCSQTAKKEQIKGVIINPEITDLKFSEEELKEY